LGRNSKDGFWVTVAGFLEVLLGKLDIPGITCSLYHVVKRFFIWLDLHEVHFLQDVVDPGLEVLRRLFRDEVEQEIEVFEGVGPRVEEALDLDVDPLVDLLVVVLPVQPLRFDWLFLRELLLEFHQLLVSFLA
jgi:hypothetical protein